MGDSQQTKQEAREEMDELCQSYGLLSDDYYRALAFIESKGLTDEYEAWEQT